MKVNKSFYQKGVEYIIALVCIITLNFFLPRLMPGDPFTFLSTDEGDVTASYSQQEIERYKAYYGLDKPLFSQYINYIKNVLTGNLGHSIYYDTAVNTMIYKRIGWTLFLVLTSILLGAFLGTVMGSISAWYRNKFLDKIMYFGMVVFSEVPSFLVALLLLFLLAAGLGWFPLSGGMSHFTSYASRWHMIRDMAHHAVLPVTALVLNRVGGFYLLARSSMVLVLSKDYIRTAKGKGLKKIRILFRHALRNAMLPIITRFFMSIGVVMGGAIVVENVFNYPGIGRLMRQAVVVRDYPLIQGIFLIVTMMVLTTNLLADIIYKKLDPRVK